MAEIDCHAAVIVAVAAHDLTAASGDTVADHRDYRPGCHLDCHLGCHLDSLNNYWNYSGSLADSVDSCCYFHASVNCVHLHLNGITDEIKWGI